MKKKKTEGKKGNFNKMVQSEFTLGEIKRIFLLSVTLDCSMVRKVEKVEKVKERVRLD